MNIYDDSTLNNFERMTWRHSKKDCGQEREFGLKRLEYGGYEKLKKDRRQFAYGLSVVTHITVAQFKARIAGRSENVGVYNMREKRKITGAQTTSFFLSVQKQLCTRMRHTKPHEGVIDRRRSQPMNSRNWKSIIWGVHMRFLGALILMPYNALQSCDYICDAVMRNAVTGSQFHRQRVALLLFCWSFTTCFAKACNYMPFKKCNRWKKLTP